MKYLLLASLLFVSSVTSANQSAEVVRVDFMGFEFTTVCSEEIVTVSSGVLHILVRQDTLNVNGFHILNNVAGSFRAVGQSTGDEYLVNVTAPSRPPLTSSIQNFATGRGATNLILHLEIINLSNPGSGISLVQVVIVNVFSTPNIGENKVFEVSMECVGR